MKQDFNQYGEGDPHKRSNQHRVLGPIVTWIIFGAYAVGVCVALFAFLDRPRLRLVVGATALSLALLFTMAKYIVYSARKEKQTSDHLAHNNEPIR